jgi:hypothetical protein
MTDRRPNPPVEEPHSEPEIIPPGGQPRPPLVPFSHMVEILLAGFLTMLAVCFANAQQSKHDPKAVPKQVKTQTANPCAKYGPGFKKLEGSDTCVKVGGSIDVEAGGRR